MIDGSPHFGFSRDEAEAYLLLLRAGPCPAGIVSRKLGIDRMKAYRTLKALEERGLVIPVGPFFLTLVMLIVFLVAIVLPAKEFLRSKSNFIEVGESYGELSRHSYLLLN